MTFTEEQFNTLSSFEDYFHKAIYAQWSPNPGSSKLRVIHDIYTDTTGDRRRFSDNCQHCILSLLTDCGRLYFRDKEEREAEARASLNKAVAAIEAQAETVKKVTVKTAKKPTKRARK